MSNVNTFSTHKVAAFVKKINNELERQLLRQSEAAAIVESNNVDPDTFKDAEEAYKNATNRIRYARKLLAITNEQWAGILPMITHYDAIIVPRDLYAHGDAVLMYAKAAAFGAKLGDKFAEWVNVFCSKGVTVDGKHLDAAVAKCGLKECEKGHSNRRWRNGIPEALEIIGAVSVNWGAYNDGRKSKRIVESATLDVNHPIVAALQQKAWLGEIKN